MPGSRKYVAIYHSEHLHVDNLLIYIDNLHSIIFRQMCECVHEIHFGSHMVVLADFARKLHSCVVDLTFKCLKGYEQQQMNLNREL